MDKCIDYDKSCQDRYWWLNKTGGTAHDNMTVLDYFAAQAMAALIASPRLPAIRDSEGDVTDEGIADLAYKVATAMMNERTKQESNDA